MQSQETLVRARVSFAAHEHYRVLTDAGQTEAFPSGNLRWKGQLPAVGDWVEARFPGENFAWIESVLERSTKFSRRAAGSGLDEQVIAANVDIGIIVCGLDGDFNLRRIERYLVLVYESGADPAIVLNKADLCRDLDQRLSGVRTIAPSVETIALCARDSVDALHAIVANRTVVLLGSSGAGKSTIVNGLLGWGCQSTAEVREADSRGRHTTTNRMLIPLAGGGAIIDTPGLRELQLWAEADTLNQVFEEIAEAAGHCRFRDCTHANEPGCAVRESLESGAITSNRWAGYRKLQAELRRHEIESDIHARIKNKQWIKKVHKAMRADPKGRA